MFEEVAQVNQHVFGGGGGGGTAIALINARRPNRKRTSSTDSSIAGKLL